MLMIKNDLPDVLHLSYLHYYISSCNIYFTNDNEKICQMH